MQSELGHTLRPYPAYKDSGVPWLGKIPEHWDLRRMGSAVLARSDRGRNDLPLLSVLREKGVVLRSSLKEEENRNFAPDDLSNYKIVQIGNLVINKMKAWQGSLGVSAFHGVVSPAYHVYEFSMANRQYAHALLRSRPYVALFARASDGVRIGQWDLSIDGFKNIPLIIPSEPEQSAIVRFLDYTDRRIRGYIRAKQKLIALLNEQKQAIIHKAVTRGLDPNVRLKPSGVEWLGDVPEHWEVVPLKYLSNKIQNGATPPTTEKRFYEDGSIPWYGPSSFTDVTITNPVRYLHDSAFEEGRARLITAPAILVVVIGATAGKVGLLTENGSSNQQITAFEISNDTFSPLFVVHQLRFAELWLRNTASTATIPIIDSHILSRVAVGLPRLAEQREILSVLSADLFPLERSISQANKEISLIREYRTRLIADVVTGKLDVREAAAQLPEEKGEDAEESDESLAGNGMLEDASEQEDEE